MCVLHLFQGNEYLIQWSGYPLTDCSWELENNPPGYLITNFNQPPASESRVKIFSRLFEDAIQRRLRSRNNRVVIQFDSDIYIDTCLVAMNLDYSLKKIYPS